MEKIEAVVADVEDYDKRILDAGHDDHRYEISRCQSARSVPQNWQYLELGIVPWYVPGACEDVEHHE